MVANILETPEIGKDLSLAEAKDQIMFIRQQIAQMGANDVEFFSIDAILTKLEKEEFSPREAVEEARGVLSSKQDYR